MLRYQIRTAVTWTIVAQLFRRQGHLGFLRVLETHPGGGQYDCLSLYLVAKPDGLIYGGRGSSRRHLCDFNQGSGRLRVFDVGRDGQTTVEELPWPNKADYVAAFLVAD